MLLQNQVMLTQANPQLTPGKVGEFAQGFSLSSTWNFTIPTPTEGNFIVICAGGSQDRSPTFSGWNHLDITGDTNSMVVFWKFAGAGETTSLSITWSGNLAGSIQYFEFTNIDPTNPVISGYATASSFTAATSHSWGSYDVNEPSVYITTVANNTGVATISVDNGFDTPTPTGRASAAWRVYNGPDLGEVTTWTFDSSTGFVGLVAFRGRIL